MDASTDIEAIFTRQVKTVYRLCYSYLGSPQEAEDATQSVFMKLVDAPQTFADAEHEKAWLLRVASNVSKNRLKYRAVRRADELSEQLAAEDDPDLAFVWDAVGQLPEQQREVIHLYYQESYSTREIASILDRNESTVRSDLTRGRNALKDVLKEAYDFG